MGQFWLFIKTISLLITVAINVVLVTGVGEPQTEEDHQAVLKYEEWLRQNDMWLSTNIQTLEQQVAKYRRTKKALNAKQRVVC